MANSYSLVRIIDQHANQCNYAQTYNCYKDNRQRMSQKRGGNIAPVKKR